MAQYHTAIVACGTIARVHTRGWRGVAGQPTQIAAIVGFGIAGVDYSVDVDPERGLS